MVDSRAVMEALLQAIQARDVKGISELLAEDVSAETEAIPTPIRGKGVLIDLLGGALEAFEEVRVQPKKLVVSGNDVAAFVNIHVKFGRDVSMLGETFSVAGKQLKVVGALFVEMNDAGKIVRLMRVRDTMSIVRQLGIAPQQVEGLTRKFAQKLQQQSVKKPAA